MRMGVDLPELGAIAWQSLLALGYYVSMLTVLAVHRAVAWLCARYRAVRHLLRGRPRALVRDGIIVAPALREEGVSIDELMAGLRKLGYESPAAVKLAVLEETGHVSAIAAVEPQRADATPSHGDVTGWRHLGSR
jgi:uncharacterized membrane protein YcaP (DUF421 family)